MSRSQSRPVTTGSEFHATAQSSPAIRRSDETELTVNWRPIANYLGVKERAFWKLVHEQGLPNFRLNARLIRFRLSDVQNWLTNYRKGEA
jgi:excisionase family DNA binding protein